MQILLYDGTFDGFLTALYDAFYLRTLELDFQLTDTDRVSFFPCQEVITKQEKVLKISEAIHKELTERAFGNIYCAFLSHRENIEYDIFLYLKLSFHRHRNMDDTLQNAWIARVVKAANAVRSEAHRFLGILRFSEFSGIYAADMEPDNDILPLIVSHFADRFANQPFIIRDLRHQCAAVHKENRTLLIPMTEFSSLNEAGGDEWEQLWKSYYKTMAIPERKNVKLMQSFIPQKYWKHLLEKEETL